MDKQKSKRLLSRIQIPFTGVAGPSSFSIDSLVIKTRSLKKKIRKKVNPGNSKNCNYSDDLLISPELLDLLVKYLSVVSKKNTADKPEIIRNISKICEDIQRSQLFFHQEYIIYFLKNVYEGKLKHKRDIWDALNILLGVGESLGCPGRFLLTPQNRLRAIISYRDLEYAKFLLEPRFSQSNPTLKYILHKCPQWPVQMEGKLLTLYDKKRNRWGLWPQYKKSRYSSISSEQQYLDDFMLTNCIKNTIEILLEIASKGQCVNVQNDRVFSVQPLRIRNKLIARRGKTDEPIKETTLVGKLITSKDMSANLRPPKKRVAANEIRNAACTGKKSEECADILIGIPIIVSMDANAHSWPFVTAQQCASRELKIRTPYIREFAEVLTISGAHIRIWRFERNGAVSSFKLNVNKDWKKFVRIILGYFTMSLVEMGVKIPEHKSKRSTPSYEHRADEESLVMVQCVQRIDGFEFLDHHRLLLSEEVKYIKISRKRFLPQKLNIFAAFSKVQLAISDFPTQVDGREGYEEGSGNNLLQITDVPEISCRSDDARNRSATGRITEISE